MADYMDMMKEELFRRTIRQKNRKFPDLTNSVFWGHQMKCSLLFWLGIVLVNAAPQVTQAGTNLN